ncbi:DUF3558 family protein [Tomitella biformata]|uniref:DUF3558 family protein n=1 Tax=Tomitella biformata TaxID=630403 RepID=UPI001F2BF095|nr:DUF3558 family protein [Tomitella biformata]
MLLICVALTSCSTTTSGSPVASDAPSSSPVVATSKSTIVSQMDNYYEENPALSIDPCHDSFIDSMATLGLKLDAEVILPKGQQYFGYWYASCRYTHDGFSALTESSTAPFMMPGETLEPKHDDKGRSRLIEIQGRSTIVRPPANGGKTCMVSMATTFGSMTITGSDHRDSNPDPNCDRIIELLRQIEPWIND